MQSWADAEWFTNNDKVPESITVAVFKPLAKSIPTISARHRMLGRAQIFHYTPALCLK
jgi:aconitase B